jgi:hypothetical protein
MRRLYFWEEWTQPYKKIYWLFFILFILSLLIAIFNYFFGLEYVIHWESIGKLDQLKLIAHTVTAGSIRLEIPIDNFIVFQYFEGSNLEINALNGYIFLLALIIGVNLVMALLPSLPKIWFYAGMGGFIGFVVLLNIDQIMLFGQTDKTGMIIVLVLYLSAGYFYKEIKPEIGLFKRFVVFSMISGLIGILFHQYAGVSDPFLYIANYGIFASIIITILFIIFVAHEVIYGFLHLITNSNTIGSKNSLNHFIFISIFYLAYVWITYMHYTGQIRWDLIYLDPFFLAGLTFILGIWGFKKRENLFKEIFYFYPVGALFYLAFGIISINTLSYIFISANDPLMETFEDAILYSQISFGIMFFIYVVANFGPLLLLNKKVSKIAYQSRVLPFFVFRIGGFIVFGFTIYSASFLPYYQSMAGYYNYVGDIFMIENKLDLAEEYYKEASLYEYQNHRSNYAMATLSRMKNDKYDEAYYFRNALLKNPSEFSYVNLSNIYLKNDQYFDGMFELRDALSDYPDSYQILNNLGYFYTKTDLADSSFYYFDQSDKNRWNTTVPASNIYGLLAKSNIEIPMDSLESLYPVKDDLAGIANKLAMKNLFDGFNNQGALEAPELEYNFDAASFAYLYNNAITILKSGNTAFFDKLLNYGDSSGIDFYISRLRVLTSLNKYFNHQVTESFRLLYELGEMAVLNDEYFNMLGILALDINSPRLAVDYFKRTSTQINDKYRLNLAIAYAEAGMQEEALQTFQSLENSDDADVGAVSSEFINLYQMNIDVELENADNENKYLIYRYRVNKQDSSRVAELLASISNSNIKDLIRLEQANAMIDEKRWESANEYFSEVNEGQLIPGLKPDYKKVQYMMVQHGLIDSKKIPEMGELGSEHPLFLYDQLLYAQTYRKMQDSINLDPVYEKLASWDPFFEEGVISATDYFKYDRDRANYSYNLLVNALTVNSYSIPLNKYFITYCLEEGLLDFAKNRLEYMKSFMDMDEFSNYSSEINAIIDLKESEMKQWGS